MTITLIAAVARNGVIGVDGRLPWRIPADLKRFKALTFGGTLIMGRKTYESIGRPLPGRTSIVVTRQPDWTAEGVLVAHSVGDALAQVVGDGWVAGGGEIYAGAMPYADRIELTEVDEAPEGDALFPEWDRTTWREVAREQHQGYGFLTYDRI